MGRSRLAWAGSATAPWAIALGFLVSITAQAEQDPSAATQGVSRRSPVFSAGGPPPGLIAARYTVGSADELGDLPDEIQPNAAFKPKRAPLPGINRQAKGDPFVPLRPGYEARAHAELVSASPHGEADWPAAGRSPAAATTDIAPPAIAYTDGATPGLPLGLALNSASPRPDDIKIRVATRGGKWAPAAAPVAVAPTPPGAIHVLDEPGKPNYASLIDPKDATRQMRCLAEAIYFESRSEPESGQAAVAQVVLNRVRSGIFPTNVCGVVYQDANRPFACQFSFACEGKSLRIEEPGAWAVATRIADEVVRGVSYDDKLVTAVNYHANYVYPFWAPSLRRVEKIGAHLFYAMKPGLYWAPGALNGRGDLPPAPTQQAAK